MHTRTEKRQRPENEKPTSKKMTNGKRKIKKTSVTVVQAVSEDKKKKLYIKSNEKIRTKKLEHVICNNFKSISNFKLFMYLP